MAWNDGITKELSTFLDELAKIPDEARKVSEQVIDEEVKGYIDRVEPKIPIDKGNLKKAFKSEKINQKNFYGYKAFFEGETADGTPYEEIANILNYGVKANDKSKGFTGTFFITKAIKKLKGMTARINARVDAEIENRLKEQK